MVGRLKVEAEFIHRLDERFRSVVGLVTFPIPFDEGAVASWVDRRRVERVSAFR